MGRGGAGMLCMLSVLLLTSYTTSAHWAQPAAEQTAADASCILTEEEPAWLTALIPTLTPQSTPQPTATPVPRTVEDAELVARLDELCAAQPGGFSVYLKDLENGSVYLHAADTLYYPASTLKAPYALWLCRMADDGVLDLDEELPNQFAGMLAGTTLEAYDVSPTIPVRDLLHAMVTYSDNNAVTMLTSRWPAEENFESFLAELGFSAPETCLITPDTGILGAISARDLGLAMEALYAYFETDSENAACLQQCFLAADHDILYVPEGVSAAKKYGSWDYAYHDAAIVYAAHPYLLVCMTDQGDEEVDFPAQPTAAMQTLGQIVYDWLNG